MQSRVIFAALIVRILFLHAPLTPTHVTVVQAYRHICPMVCNSSEDLPCRSEGHSHAGGGGEGNLTSRLGQTCKADHSHDWSQTSSYMVTVADKNARTSDARKDMEPDRNMQAFC